MSKKRRFAYLFSMNYQIKLLYWYLVYILNTKVIKILKLVNKINVTIENNQQILKKKILTFKKKQRRKPKTKPY